MERDSILYKLRRKGQAVAQRILPNIVLTKIYSKIVIGKNVNLKDPKTFNEKIQWMKLYYYPYNPLVIKCTDKYAVREYIENKRHESILVPLLGIWNSGEEIDWDKLPKQFVLKCNHGCAYNIIVHDKNRLDKKRTAKRLNAWLKEDFGVYNIEPHYSKIKPHRIICEEFLGDDVIDYKFFCFNGKPKFVYVSSDLIHDRQAKISFFYLDGSKMPLVRDDYATMNIKEFPECFNSMKTVADDLCKDFPFVRVDFFVTDEKFYFAELTFTPGGGMMPFNPDMYDLELGEALNIEMLIKEKDCGCIWGGGIILSSATLICVVMPPAKLRGAHNEKGDCLSHKKETSNSCLENYITGVYVEIILLDCFASKIEPRKS